MTSENILHRLEANNKHSTYFVRQSGGPAVKRDLAEEAAEGFSDLPLLGLLWTSIGQLWKRKDQWHAL